MPAARLAKLDDLAVIDVRGEDAAAFLQAQLCGDVLTLPPGQCRFTAWCDPKGRVIASFLLARRAPGFRLILRRDLAATGLTDRVAWVDLAAANAAQFKLDPVDLVQKIVDDVQQRLQDEFVDTTWPTCARHPNHPMEFSAGAWHCPRGGVVARLGEVRE